MHILTVLCILAALGLFVVTASALKKRKARKKAIAAPFPESWVRIIEKNLPPYLKLPEESRDRLYGYIQEFLYDKSFEGCGGLDLDDEIKVTIAAQACLLLMNKEVRCYPKLRTVLVYPSTYVAGKKGLLGTGPKDPSVRLGESWKTGLVVLAWDSVKQGAMNFADGRNVTIHEFAHQLDQEDGSADGAPILDSRSAYSAWAMVLSKEYERLRKKSKKRKKSVMRSYGATNPAEFFAVASETFFEKPKQMKKKHPDLFKELKKFYKVDPTEWVSVRRIKP
jgi:Mlc titration factor MtfA (ptsG expression regulator)